MEAKELHTDLMIKHGLYIVKHKHYNNFYEYVGDRVNICVLCIDEKYNKPHLFPLDVTRDDDKDSDLYWLIKPCCYWVEHCIIRGLITLRAAAREIPLSRLLSVCDVNGKEYLF